MRRALAVSCLITTLTLAAQMAFAEGAGGALARDLVSRRIVLDEGQLAAELTAELNLAFSYKLRPLSLAPDLWLGVTRRLTIGVVHSNASVDRFAPGSSVCLRTDDVLYCDAAYHGSGLDARYEVTNTHDTHGTHDEEESLLGGELALAPRGRVLIRDVDPFKPALTAGALVKWTRGRYAVIADPYIQLGLANRDEGNRSSVFLPLELAIQPTCRWQLSLHTGWNAELVTISDGYRIPLALAVRARATTEIDVGATVGFASLLGPQNTPKQRVLFIAVGWALGSR